MICSLLEMPEVGPGTMCRPVNTTNRCLLSNPWLVITPLASTYLTPLRCDIDNLQNPCHLVVTVLLVIFQRSEQSVMQKQFSNSESRTSWSFCCYFMKFTIYVLHLLLHHLPRCIDILLSMWTTTMKQFNFCATCVLRQAYNNFFFFIWVGGVYVT